MSLPLDEFIKRLTSCGLMSGDEFASFQRELPQSPQTVDDLSRLLLENARLTKFQIGILQGEDGPPLVLGHYELRDTIGAGGMGQVYLARHRRMKRNVALKVLRSTINQQPQAIRRFEREVEAVAQLSHPNIVVAYDAGDEQGVYFYVMEYVAGRNLASIAKTGSPIDVTDAVDWILQAARGLEYAHSRNVIHRDIKPSNLLLDNEGVVKVLDLGLARIDEAEPDTEQAQDGLTSTGTVMGTADFMAPEQALNAKNADHRSDIYSLGCSLFYLIVGRAIYQGESVIEKILAHRDEPIPSLAAKRADVPQSLDAVFAKMVAKKPDQRYQSMTEVIVAFDNCELATKTATTQDGTSSAIAGVTQVTAQGSTDRAAPTVAYVEASDAAVESQETHIAAGEQPTVIADDEATGTTVIRRRRRTFLITGVLLAAGVLIAIGAALWPPQSASKNPIEPAADSTTAGPIHEDVPGLLMESQLHRQHGNWNLIPTHARGIVRSWNFSPDGSEIAVRCGRMYYLYDAETLRGTRLILNNPEMIDPRHMHSPREGSWPSPAEDWTLTETLVKRPAVIQANDEARSEGTKKAFRQTGRFIAVSKSDGTIEVAKIDDSPPRLFAGHPSGVAALSWHPTLSMLTSCGQNGDVGFWPLGDEEAEMLATGIAGINRIFWTSDGGRFLLTTGDGRLAVGSREGMVGAVQPNPDGAIQFVVWSPNGEWFVTQAANGAMRLWDAAETEQVELAGAIPPFNFRFKLMVSWNPESTEIAYCRGATREIGIWNIAEKQPRSLPLPADSIPIEVKWTRSTNQLVVQSRVDSPRSKINDFATLVRQFILLDPQKADRPLVVTGPSMPFKHGHRRQICFSPDGSRLLVTTGTQLTILQRDGQVESKLMMDRSERRYVAWRTDDSIYYKDDLSQTIIRWKPEEQQTTTLSGSVASLSRWSVNPKLPLHAIGTSDGRLIVRNDEGTDVGNNSAHSGRTQDVAWTPDGTRVATVGDDGNIKVWAPDGSALALLSTNDAYLRSVTWHPTDDLLVTETDDHELYWWDVEKNILTKRQGADIMGGDEELAWSPDGEWLAAPEGFRIHLWKADSTPGPVVARTTCKVQGVTWSPDGKTLAVLDAGMTVSLWNTSDWSLDRYILLFEGDQTITIAGDGTILHGDAGLIEKELRYVVLTPAGKRVLLKPSEFSASLPSNPR